MNIIIMKKHIEMKVIDSVKRVFVLATIFPFLSILSSCGNSGIKDVSTKAGETKKQDIDQVAISKPQFDALKIEFGSVEQPSSYFVLHDMPSTPNVDPEVAEARPATPVPAELLAWPSTPRVCPVLPDAKPSTP